jgi:ribose/xylose/arabinose/galactoside ABC-type transport system permease subunit/ABC-type sugar transport system substrate-binding protein
VGFGLTSFAAPPGSSPTNQVPAGKQRTIALLFDSLTAPFWLQSREVLRREAERRGWAVLEAVSNMDDSRQYQQLKAMIQREVDGIIIAPTDNKAVIPAIQAANEAHIPIVCFNRPPAESDAYSVAVVCDNRDLMRRSVLALIEKARSKGEPCKAALLVGDLGDLNAVNRRAGFEAAVAQNKDFVEVVAEIPTDWNADKAFAGLVNALQAHPDINMLVTSSDFLTPQIEQALRLAGKWKKTGEPGHVWLAGFDGDENAYRGLAAGYYDVDGVQNIGYEVKLAYKTLEREWRGEKPAKILVDPGLVVTQNNLKETRSDMWGYQVWLARWSSADYSTGRANQQKGTVPEAPQAQSNAGSVLANLAAGIRSMFTWGTAADIFTAMLPLAILATGELLVLLLCEIDLSMPGIMGLGAILAAAVMTRHGAGQWEASLSGILVCLAIGALMGAFNGVCTAVVKMPSFIVTLVTMMTGGGAAVWYASTLSNSVSIGGLPKSFCAIGYGTWFGIPIAFVLCAAVLLATNYILSRTIIGRWIYAIGHNPKTAQISGVPVTLVTIGAFAASGFCAALAAIIYTSRMQTGSPTLGKDMLLDIIGAAIIGGVSLFGGRGTVRMVIVGVLFLSVLDKALQLMGLPFFIVLSVKGIAILAATFIDITRHRRAAKA